jgi:threonine dehydratase
VIEVETRSQAESSVDAYIAQGAYLIHPYDHDDVILGQGTACFEALKTGLQPDAIFAPCGGGGLLSGTMLAAKLLAPQARVYGAEPEQANDAARSLKAGKIIEYDASPDTIADGVRTLRVSPRTFAYFRQLSGIFEIAETDIIYWFQWINHILKTTCEPTSALGLAAAFQWLKSQTSPKTVLIILSGGNIDPETQVTLWQKNLLLNPPL